MRTPFTRRRPADRDGGYAPVELAPLTLVYLLFLGLLIVAGRITLAHLAVDTAARDAARQASIARTPGAAQTEAVQSAGSALASDGLDCTAVVTVDVSGFAVPPGQPAEVTATVTCNVRLSDLWVPVPGSRTLTATFASALDPYRAR